MDWELGALKEIRDTGNDEYVWFWRRRELRQQGLYEREQVAGVGYIRWQAKLTHKGEERLADLEGDLGYVSSEVAPAQTSCFRDPYLPEAEASGPAEGSPQA